jgi:hypothetical protein
MNDKTLNQAGRASIADLQNLAAEGVQRALAARAQGMSELSTEQAKAVSGGAVIANYLINGRLIRNGAITPLTTFNPAAAQLNPTVSF